MVNTHIITCILIWVGTYLIASDSHLIFKIIGGLIFLAGFIVAVINDVRYEELKQFELKIKKKESKKDGPK